jgi:hypothetical protein
MEAQEAKGPKGKRRITMQMKTSITLCLAGIALAATATTAQQSSSKCPLHDEHLVAVNKRGASAMGFSQEKTRHHFSLETKGGVIEVVTVDVLEIETRESVRAHLKQIARSFAAGDFSIPTAVHAQRPPGISEMKRLRSDIKYQYQETDKGAKVRIQTGLPGAINAIHDFLRFQILDHQTGDSLKVISSR